MVDNDSSNSQATDQLQPATRTFADAQVSSLETSAMANQRLPVPALRFLGRIEAGMSEEYARNQLHVSSEQVVAWKQLPDFRLAFEGAAKLRSAFKRADALAIAEANAAPLMAEAVGIAYEAQHARDKLSAIEHVHRSVGIGQRDANVTAIQVNVGASSRAWARQNEES